jgi:predicted TIM-barrel fold metal-dependent hydrolase
MFHISRPLFHALTVVACLVASALAASDRGIGVRTAAASTEAQQSEVLFHDAHVHIWNFVQKGPTIHQFLEMMGSKVGRSVLFGLPLQQQWSYYNSGDFAPSYYLQSDAPLYYYSFTDAAVAMAYKSLSPEQQARFDPMIIGFNPSDMYAVDHIRRVLTTFPGVFSGIGEFSVHKEFVSSKIAGETASLTNPALDRIMEFAAEVGLPIILHSDISVPFAPPDAEPYLVMQLKALFERHPNTTIIWAHIGVGRTVAPLARQLDVINAICSRPEFSHVYMDISWDQAAKYVTNDSQTLEVFAAAVNACPDRFLFGTDVVAPKSLDAQLAVYELWAPFWTLLTPEARQKVTKGNYERIFDAARKSVRAWEEANADQPLPEKADWMHLPGAQ